jgi:hypothetical protein
MAAAAPQLVVENEKIADYGAGLYPRWSNPDTVAIEKGEQSCAQQ